jgi:hypothetical protein
MTVLNRSENLEQDPENETAGAIPADASPFETAPMTAMEISTAHEGEVLTLPHSTHCFLFTEPMGSIPFLFGLVIAAMTYTCLALALTNSFENDGALPIPYNVVTSVRIAQYLAIFIALLMEKGKPFS